MPNVTAIRKKIIPILNQYLGSQYLLIAFGSLVNGGFSQSSDLDLAVYRKKRIPPRLMAELQEEMEQRAGTLRDVDLVNLTEENINHVLFKNILDKGHIWHAPKNLNALLESLKKRSQNSSKPFQNLKFM